MGNFKIAFDVSYSFLHKLSLALYWIIHTYYFIPFINPPTNAYSCSFRSKVYRSSILSSRPGLVPSSVRWPEKACHWIVINEKANRQFWTVVRGFARFLKCRYTLSSCSYSVTRDHQGGCRNGIHATCVYQRYEERGHRKLAENCIVQSKGGIDWDRAVGESVGIGRRLRHMFVEGMCSCCV